MSIFLIFILFLDGDEFGVDQEGEGEGGGDGKFDVADLDSAGVEDSDGVGIVGVEGLADEADHFTASDGAGVVLDADDVGDEEAEHVGIGGGGSRERIGVVGIRGALPLVEAQQEAH